MHLSFIYCLLGFIYAGIVLVLLVAIDMDSWNILNSESYSLSLSSCENVTNFFFLYFYFDLYISYSGLNSWHFPHYNHFFISFFIYITARDLRKILSFLPTFEVVNFSIIVTIILLIFGTMPIFMFLCIIYSIILRCRMICDIEVRDKVIAIQT